MQWKYLKKKSSVGKPTKGSKIIIIDKKGDKKNNVTGEIYLKGENVCLDMQKHQRSFKKDTNKKTSCDLALKMSMLFILLEEKRIIKIWNKNNMDEA